MSTIFNDEPEAAEIEVINMPMELSVFDPIDTQLARAKEEDDLKVFDYDDPQENKEARSWIAHLRKLKRPVNETHALGKAEALNYCRDWDTAKKKRMDFIQELIERHYKHIRAIEEKETQRLAEEKLKKEQEETAVEAARQAEIEKRECKLAEDEAKLQAARAEYDRKEHEKKMCEKWSREAEEKNKQIAIDAENAKKAAEEKVKQDAINAENARKQAAIDAENAKAAAVQRAKDEAVAAAAEKERLVAEEVEKDRIYQLQLESQKQERIADKQHRSEIHRAIYRGWEKVFIPGTASISKGMATALTQALIDNKIPHVTIKY